MKKKKMSVPRTYSGRLMSEHYYFTIPELEQMDGMASEVKKMNKTMSLEAEASTDMTTFDDHAEEKRRWQEYWSCEQSIIGARASVMVYDDMNKKWIPSGSSSGLSKVQIYHHQQNNTFRVVGRKLQDHEVVINCSILKGLKYNQATSTFHQWRDSKFVYGLNFSSQQDAEAFARAMMHALEVLSGRVIPTTAPPQPGVNSSTAYEEDMGYRTMTREDAAIIQQQQQIVGQQGVAPSPQTPTTQIPQSPPTPQGHHRTSSAPPAPQPPPMALAPQSYNQTVVHQQQQQQQQQQQVPPGGPGYQQLAGYGGQPVQNSYGASSSVSQQFNQQPIYVSSSGNQVPQIHHMQQQHSQNGPIYVSSQGVPVPPPGLPTSASTTNVYGQQQSLGPGAYGQSNGQAAAPVGGGQVPIPPQMPPQAPPMPPSFGGGVPQPPAPAPPAPGPPPPPPPPGHAGGAGKSEGAPAGGMDLSTLAAQLQNARLRRNQKTTPPPAENSGSSTSSGSSGNYGTIGRTTTGMASMMDEMAKTLARRRAQAERKEPDSDDLNSSRRPWEKSNTLPHKLGNAAGGGNSSSPGSGGIGSGNASGGGPESPRPQRKRFGSASEETILKQVNGDGLSLPLTAELDNIKAEILREMRIEINKAKQEIIEVIKSEFNRR
ncbi:protein enabled isoform X5 [Phlebotomus papatasi]|uniref:protein enabled isoform X5 n=1 Tax=Phlebotomus papatasi TaxID=29031 RepID=UPI00248358A5|nr:protein enabled isoform X5 [Phlebotomus papatasi]